MTDTLIRMPKLADTLVEGTVGRWLKRVGEAVGAGEPLASIETDKVTSELTSPAAGTVLELLVAEGHAVPVETPIARIGVATGAPAEAIVHESKPASREPKATPVAARLLAEHGLKSGDVSHAGKRRVTKDDVLRHVSQKSTSTAPESPPRTAEDTPQGKGEWTLVPLSSMRRAIAEHMQRARQTIPHGQTVMQADLTELALWRERAKAAFAQRERANLTFSVLFVHALARAIDRPADIGVAIALDNGLIVPVLRNADKLSLGETARGIADLASRARAGHLTAEELQGALMTVTNVGSFGNLTASPIIPEQQLGILGPGLVERRPMPAPNGAIRVGWRCLLTLMFDRRAFDDLTADRLLRRVVEHLEQFAAETESVTPRVGRPQ